MFNRSAPRVTIAQQGREGRVFYQEGPHSLSGYQEFGGGDVVVILSMGTADEWRQHHPWAAERHAAILRFVADECIRQKAPTCVAEINESTGTILLRSGAPAPAAGPAPEHPAAWMARHAALRERIGNWVMGAAVVLAAAIWVKEHWLG